MPAVSPADLALPPPAERTADIARRVAAARRMQRERYAGYANGMPVRTNAEADGALLDRAATPDENGRRLLAGPWSGCTCRRAPIIGFYGSPARSPISMAPTPSSASISPKRCRIGAWSSALAQPSLADDARCVEC